MMTYKSASQPGHGFCSSLIDDVVPKAKLRGPITIMPEVKLSEGYFRYWVELIDLVVIDVGRPLISL
jgi:hypothetical protein